MTSHPKRYAFRVSGDGHGGQPFGSQPFSLQPPEPGCQLPTAEKPTPELPMPVPVTRHHVFLTLPILNTPYSILSYPTFAQAAGRFAPLHGMFASLANWPTNQLVN